MALADTIMILEDGTITEIDTPANLLRRDGYISKLGLKLVFGNESIEEIPQHEEALQSDESSQTSKEVVEEVKVAQHDLRRKNGDLGVYQYYFKSAGAGVVALYAIFVTLWQFCTNFSGESKLRDWTIYSTYIDLTPLVVLLKWWSEANNEQPNRDIGMWMGLYAMLGILGTLGIFISAW